jgi:hypothetical protein
MSLSYTLKAFNFSILNRPSFRFTFPIYRSFLFGLRWFDLCIHIRL